MSLLKYLNNFGFWVFFFGITCNKDEIKTCFSIFTTCFNNNVYIIHKPCIMRDLVIRMKWFFDYKELSLTDLSVNLQYNSPQKLYRLFNTENASPSCQIIEDISNNFPELNLNWLFTGRGNMLLSVQENVDFKEKYYKCLEEKEGLYKELIRERDNDL